MYLWSGVRFLRLSDTGCWGRLFHSSRSSRRRNRLFRILAKSRPICWTPKLYAVRLIKGTRHLKLTWETGARVAMVFKETWAKLPSGTAAPPNRGLRGRRATWE